MNTTLLESINLSSGTHRSRETGLCVMEAAAMLAGEPHTDDPKCVCPVVRRFCIVLNDRMPDSLRQELKWFLPRIVGSVASAAVVERRRWIVVDAALRVFAPMALRAVKLPEWAEKLEAIPEVANRELMLRARVVVLDAATAATAATATTTAFAATTATAFAANAATFADAVNYTATFATFAADAATAATAATAADAATAATAADAATAATAAAYAATAAAYAAYAAPATDADAAAAAARKAVWEKGLQVLVRILEK